MAIPYTRESLRQEIERHGWEIGEYTYGRPIGDHCVNAGEYDKTLQSFEEAGRLGDLSPVLDAKRGAAEMGLGYADKGLKRIRRAVYRNPLAINSILAALSRFKDVPALAAMLDRYKALQPPEGT